MVKVWKKFGIAGLSLLFLLSTYLFQMTLGPETPTSPEMVRVKAGTFQMGDEAGDLWQGCRPVHTVLLTYDYWIGKYEVTFAEYDEFCSETGRRLPDDYGWGRGSRPVVDVNWQDAASYCNWLSEREGLRPAYNDDGELIDRDGRVTADITRVEGYRLPTEAEWEYAASGGHEALAGARFLYSGSNDIDEVAWYFDNSGDEMVYRGDPLTVDYSKHGASLIQGKSTQPVGQKKPNQLGVYDMSGNVWEWCHDWYGNYTGDSKTNPTGPPAGHVRVMRGGSWIFGANDCRVGSRFYRSPHDKIFRLGFRLAKTVL